MDRAPPTAKPSMILGSLISMRIPNSGVACPSRMVVRILSKGMPAGPLAMVVTAAAARKRQAAGKRTFMDRRFI